MRVTRRFQFCAGHRVFKHESKCAHPHGHNYVLLATFEALDGLDELGRVIDFSEIKDLLGTWLDECWDHGFIFFDQDREMFNVFFQNHTWKIYQMSENPTAENMAAHLLNVVCPELFKGSRVQAVKMELWETENCCATVERLP